MATELGLQVSGSSTRITKFHASAVSEHKFRKMVDENWLLVCVELVFKINIKQSQSVHHDQLLSVEILTFYITIFTVLKCLVIY